MKLLKHKKVITVDLYDRLQVGICEEIVGVRRHILGGRFQMPGPGNTRGRVLLI